LGAVLYKMLHGLPSFFSRDVAQMYENILHQPLQIPGVQTVAACDILQGLLRKDQRQRLGSKADFVGDLQQSTGACGGLSFLRRQLRNTSTCLPLPFKRGFCYHCHLEIP
jgi:serine/threonine protein kinase